MICGCEAWTLQKADKQKIDAAEMWFYRRLLRRVSWIDKRTNESILKEIAVDRQLSAYIEERKLKYVGHTIRNEKTPLMASILQGKMQARRRRGRHSIAYINNIKENNGMRMDEMTHRCRDCVLWRNIAKASSVAANIGQDDADR